MSDFNLELAKSLSNSSEQYPVSLEDAWQWIGYTRKDSAVDTLKSYFEEGVDYVLRLQPESDNHAGLSVQEKAAEARRQPIYLTLDCFKQLGMLARTEKGKQIRLYFLECEKIAKQAVANTIPPQFIELLNNMQQQLNVLTERTQRLDELEQHEREFGQAAQIHPGCAEILIDQIETAIDDEEMTAYEFVARYGINPEYRHRISIAAGAAQRFGKQVTTCPKQQGSQRQLYEIRYLKQAAKTVLKLN